MRRATTSVLAAALAASVVGALPATAEPVDESQRVELPQIGLAATFPADWSVMAPLSPRGSWFDVSADDETPVLLTLGATPALAQDADPSAEPTDTQRAENDVVVGGASCAPSSRPLRRCR